MKRILPFFILFLAIANESHSQLTRYIVKLKNKGGSPYSFSTPLTYLSQRSVDRRTRYGIAIDSADLPVTPSYVTQIRNIPNVTVLNVSKWLNAIAIQTTDANAITAINALPFVQSTSGIASKISTEETPVGNKFAFEGISTEVPFTQKAEGITGDYFNYGTTSFNEIHLHNAEFLHNIGLRGQGMQIAILDNGFNNYTALSSFDSININGQVLGTWDFVASEQNVTNDGSHGMQCFSTIGANIPGQFIGKAPKASFWLYQTEDNASEYPIEEFNWSCGAERSDSSGADVISTSLGYTEFDNASLNHTYADMNGNTTLASKAADMAAKKGLMVFAAVGNDGGATWHFLSTPSDGDSVVAVGAVNSAGAVGAFSSYGPSSDGQIKPDIASVGVSALVQNTNNTLGLNNGTSFACPNMAGMGACLWQAFPEYNNMKIIRTMQQSGSISATPNDRIGYGIPNMKTAFGKLLVEYATSTATVSNCTATISWRSKDVAAMKYEIERKIPGETVYTKIGTLDPSAGNILAIHNYQFTNAIISQAGTISYRIRQIIDTAVASFTAVYIDTADVAIATSCPVVIINPPPPPPPTTVLVAVQPNPASGSTTTLIVETPYAVSNMPIAIFDGKGRLVMQLSNSKTTGRKTIDIPVDKLSRGKYYIHVLNGSQTIGVAELLRL